MLVYILKFSACLAIFMMFYKLFLEKESMHQFKRFYLLAIILLAIGIPLITFIEYVEPIITTANIEPLVYQVPANNPEVIIAESTSYLPIILWSIYGLGVLLFLSKFILNLSGILIKIKRNPKFKSQHIINVLLNDHVTPHTFFNFIFLNKQRFETHQIPNEVLLHEETHAKQKHSIDILFIELIQILFWFNPIIYFIKNAIKLNHEFLADQAVINKGIQASKYQHILLAFSSNATEPQLANAINYSSIKKRFTVMKTKTSKQKVWLKSLVLLPLVALTLYGFSETVEIEKETPVTEFIESIDLYLNEEGELLHNESIITLTDIEKLFLQDESLQVSVNIFPDADIEIKDKVYSDLRSIGIKKITICTSQVDEFLKQAENQQKATPEQIAEYNKIAKHCNSQIKKKLFIKVKDVKRLEYLYVLMSKTQKENAEPFPDFSKLPPPPAPPAPQAPVAQKVKKGEVLPPPPPIPATATPAQKVKMQAAIDDYNNKVPPPPPPPAPKSQLEHVIEMSKKGALFYSEGKQITSDEAIKLLKKNSELNLHIKQSDSKQPKVYITKDPIQIKN